MDWSNDRDDPFGLSTFASACLIGTFVGWLIFLGAIGLSDGSFPFGPGTLLWVLVASVPTFALAFSGLLVFGLPLLALLHRHIRKLWMGPVFAALGMISGTVYMQFLFFIMGNDAPTDLSAAATFGGSFATPTAIAWWYLMRRQLLRGD